MFTDRAKIFIKAGDGGDGCVSFHREKYIASGGPDGGDGGRGGSIIFKADSNLSTLMDFKYKRKYVAKNGEQGRSGNSSGKNAEDMYISVPVGTVVYDCLTNLVLCDLSKPGQTAVAAKGGDGGYGNKKFATPTRQIPKFAKPGYPGQEREVILELKLIADVGLVGFPNVGKSTLLKSSTRANPKIADYHFTTLTPNLGVVNLDENINFVMADIPGVIEGASEGAGLGIYFLRHVERTKLLIHVIDAASSEGRNPIEDFEIINGEMESYSSRLKEKEQIIALNKTDLIYDKSELDDLKKYFSDKGLKVFVISAATGEGVKELLYYAGERLKSIPETELYGEESLYREELDNNVATPYEIYVADDGIPTVEGPFIKKLMANTNPTDYESMQYFQRAIKSKGIIDELSLLGVKEGDTVRLEDMEFEFVL